MIQNAETLGAYFRERLQTLHLPFVKKIRGKGLLNAIVIEHVSQNAGWDLCLALKANGLLAKPTHGDKIRLSPPLIITKQQVDESIGIIEKSLATLK